MKITVINLVLILLIVFNLYSQGIPYGQEFQINTYTEYRQDFPAVAGLTQGGFVVCWSSFLQDGYHEGIFAKIYDDSVTQNGNEFQVNTSYKNDESFPTVAALSGGGFVICWQSGEQDGSESGVFCQIFNAGGDKINKEFQVNTYTQDYQGLPTIAGLWDNGFVVCWLSLEQDGSGFGIFGQLFDASGGKKGAEFRVNSTTESHQSDPKAAGLFDGGFVVCWDSQDQDGSAEGVFGQCYYASGAKKGNEFQANTYTSGTQFEPSISGLSDGGFVVCWTSWEQDGSETGVFGQRFNAQGLKIGTEFQVNSHTQGYQGSPAVTGLSDGGFVICWINTEGLNQDIKGQLFSSAGVKKGPEFRVNTYEKGPQYNPAIANFSNKMYIACWESWDQDGSDAGIFGKIFLSAPIIHTLKKYSLIEPLNDATMNTSQPNFCWQQPSSIRECYPWEVAFDLYIATDFNFSNPQIIQNIEDTTYTIDSLAAGKTYFWKVLAKNLAGDSLWSKRLGRMPSIGMEQIWVGIVQQVEFIFIVLKLEV